MTGGKKPEYFKNYKRANKGQFGTLFRCTYDGDPVKQYAIKKIPVTRPHLNLPDDEEEIKKEIANIQKISEQILKPTSIPAYYGYFRDENECNEVTYSLVFDFYPENLRKLLDEKTSIFSFAQFKSFFSDLLFGLSFLQALEICHRDLKPANLLLEEQKDGIMRIKILDYGLSQLFSMEDDEISRFEVSVEGNKLYMSPELYNAHEIKTVLNPFKADVFSFGLICLEIGSRQKIKRKEGMEKLREQINDNLAKMRNNYSHLIDKEKKEFEGMMGMIESSLDFDTKTRPDFLQLMKEKINLKKKQEKTLIHIFVEELTAEETKGFIDCAMGWKTLKDNFGDPNNRKKSWLQEKKQWKLIKENEKLQVMFSLY